jgi:hypothetical protein
MKNQSAEKERMLLKLEEHRGIIAPALKAAKVPRQTHYNWCKRDPEYKMAVDEIKKQQQNT